MSRLTWFLLGAMVMVGGQALAQWSTMTDNNGNRTGTIYTPPQSNMQQDWNGPARGMGQQLQGILQDAHRSPC
jgi:hypothetical protein